MAEKIFVNGLIAKKVPDTAPEFIVGNLSIKIDDLIAFLNQNRTYAVNGWLNVTIKDSQQGKRYAELDLYQYNKSLEEKTTKTEKEDTGTTKYVDENGQEVEIPF